MSDSKEIAKKKVTSPAKARLNPDAVCELVKKHNVTIRVRPEEVEVAPKEKETVPSNFEWEEFLGFVGMFLFVVAGGVAGYFLFGVWGAVIGVFFTASSMLS